MEGLNITERPEGWGLVKEVFNENTRYRVFCGWRGGYLGSDAWKMNSGITKIDEDEDYYYFHGNSGSCYQCHKKAYGNIDSYAGSVFANLQMQAEEKGIGFDPILEEDVDSVIDLFR